MKLATYAEAPAYMRYPNVLGGYRASGTFRSCLRSLFGLHTETFNAWTMLAGGAALNLMVWLHMWPLLPSAQAGLVMATFLTSVTGHALCSAACHVFMPLGKREFYFFRRLDVCAIYAGSVGINLALAWSVFTFAPAAANVALTAFVAACQIRRMFGLRKRERAGVLILDPSSQVLSVGSIVACWSAPLWYVILFAGRAAAGSSRWWSAVGAVASLAAGGALYAAGLPERWWPGRFDVLGHSHQLMHVGVVASQVFTCLFVFLSSRWRRP